MSTPASWPEAAEVFERVDPRLREGLRREVERRRGQRLLTRGHLVLVGHRGAGKSWLLPVLAKKAGREAVDLDARVAQRAGAPTPRALFLQSEARFRAAEREAFVSLPGQRVVAAGGGFLAHHSDLLEGHTAVLVPVSFETYCERLAKDTERPRLKPELGLKDELQQVYAEREVLHARVPTVPLAALVAAWFAPEVPT